MNGTINELKQGLLKCANENEGVIYLAEQVDMSSICKDANNTIERLEKENEQLKGCNTDLKQSLDLANERETEWANRIEGLKTDLEYAKAIIKDLLDNSHEYARQNAEYFIKGENK